VEPNADKPVPDPKSKDDTKADPKPEAKAAGKDGAKPDAKDDLKTLPVEEVMKKLGSSAEGLTQAEAAKRNMDQTRLRKRRPTSS
jgi:hypothetical protein